MPRDYETETERVRRQLRETLTPRQKLANWWDYHRKHVFIALAALLIALYFAAQNRGNLPADYTVGWVSGRELDARTVEDIAERLARFGSDENGDGIVHVDLHQMIIDLGAVIERGGGTEGQKEQGNLMALEADLSICQSVVFLTDDPASLQACTGALVYRDGGMPEAGANDWENMALAWSDCPRLGASPVEGELYLACRGCWQEDQQARWSEGWRLWKTIQSEATTEEKDDK